MMTKKKAAEDPGLFPDTYEANKLYHVVVKQQFEHAKSQIRPGPAMLRGELVEKYRKYLAAAWLKE